MMVINFDCEPDRGRDFTGPTGGIDYLLSTKRHAVDPVVLAGNPDVTRELLKQCNYSKPYTTGCLSFEEEDIPYADKLKHMASYEKTLLTGLDPEQYDICWIQHQDKGRLELNFHIVNTELTTGKRLQPWWKDRDIYRVDTWKQLVNDEYGYTSPDDPAKSRTVQFGNNNPTRKEVIEKVDSYILPMLESGEIKNPDDLKQKLNEVPSINVIRQVKSGTTIQVDGFEKNIRLKGGCYGKHFEGFGNVREIQAERARAYNAGRDQRIADNREKLRSYNERLGKERRAQYAPSLQEQSEENVLSSVVANTNDNDTHDINNNIQQLSDDELLHQQLSALRENNEAGQQIHVQSGADNSTPDILNKVSNNEYNNSIRADKIVEKSNDNEGGNFISRLRKSFRDVINQIRTIIKSTERTNDSINQFGKSIQEREESKRDFVSQCDQLDSALRRTSPKLAHAIKRRNDELRAERSTLENDKPLPE